MIPRPTDPKHAGNWLGGYYELTVKLGAPDDARLDAALAALWQAAALAPAYRRGTAGPVEMSAQSVLTGPLRSVATIPGLGSTVCAVMASRALLDDDGAEGYGDDWLDLCLPLGALGNLDKRVGGYPFGDFEQSRGWREPIEEWFATVATAVFGVVPFEHAVTGDEVSGDELAEAQGGGFGVFRRGRGGELVSEPVRRWT